jgi:hypothetical protein
MFYFTKIDFGYLEFVFSGMELCLLQSLSSFFTSMAFMNELIFLVFLLRDVFNLTFEVWKFFENIIFKKEMCFVFHLIFEIRRQLDCLKFLGLTLLLNVHVF